MRLDAGLNVSIERISTEESQATLYVHNILFIRKRNASYYSMSKVIGTGVPQAVETEVYGLRTFKVRRQLDHNDTIHNE